MDRSDIRRGVDYGVHDGCYLQIRNGLQRATRNRWIVWNDFHRVVLRKQNEQRGRVMSRINAPDWCNRILSASNHMIV
jgi:hypothetical protein